MAEYELPITGIKEDSRFKTPKCKENINPNKFDYLFRDRVGHTDKYGYPVVDSMSTIDGSFIRDIPERVLDSRFARSAEMRPTSLIPLQWDVDNVAIALLRKQIEDQRLAQVAADMVRRVSSIYEEGERVSTTNVDPPFAGMHARDEFLGHSLYENNALGFLENFPTRPSEVSVSGNLVGIVAIGNAIDYLLSRPAGPR